MATPMRWTDERIEDLARMVREMKPSVDAVAVLKEQIATLIRDLADKKAQDQAISKQLEGLTLEPFARKRQFWGQATLILSGALVGGVFAIVGALIASH